MTVRLNIEYVLCKEKVYNNDTEVLLEYCYVVDSEWLSHMWHRHFKKLFEWDDTFDEFLNCYDPEYEGTIIYMVAKQHDKIIEEDWQIPDEILYIE